MYEIQSEGLNSEELDEFMNKVSGAFDDISAEMDSYVKELVSSVKEKRGYVIDDNDSKDEDSEDEVNDEDNKDVKKSTEDADDEDTPITGSAQKHAKGHAKGKSKSHAKKEKGISEKTKEVLRKAKRSASTIDKELLKLFRPGHNNELKKREDKQYAKYLIEGADEGEPGNIISRNATPSDINEIKELAKQLGIDIDFSAKEQRITTILLDSKVIGAIIMQKEGDNIKVHHFILSGGLRFYNFFMRTFSDEEANEAESHSDSDNESSKSNETETKEPESNELSSDDSELITGSDDSNSKSILFALE